MRPAVFLDRDDTILDTRGATSHLPNPGDLTDPALVRLLPGAGPALARLRDAGLALVVFTSQGCVARGRATCAQVERVNARMRDLLRTDAGVRLDAVYYCPHHPEGHVAPFNTPHAWRKPLPGMILAAAGELRLDLSASFAVGDMRRDTDAALAAGIPPAHVFLLASGEGDPVHGGSGGGDGAEQTAARGPEANNTTRTPTGARPITLADAAELILRLRASPRTIHAHARSA